MFSAEINDSLRKILFGTGLCPSGAPRPTPGAPASLSSLFSLSPTDCVSRLSSSAEPLMLQPS